MKLASRPNLGWRMYKEMRMGLTVDCQKGRQMYLEELTVDVGRPPMHVSLSPSVEEIPSETAGLLAAAFLPSPAELPGWAAASPAWAAPSAALCCPSSSGWAALAGSKSRRAALPSA